MISVFEEKKVLITGGLGFIGSNLARKLVKLGAIVTIVDSLIPEYGGNLFNVQDIKDKVRINISDVRDPYSMKYLIQNQDYLFNLAGQTSHLDSMNDPHTDLEINVAAQLSILEACRKYNPQVRIVFASTRQIYGRPMYLPVDEKHPLRPVDINGINKMAGEWYHVLYYEVYDIKSTILRLTNTYGPGMRIKDARQTFLGLWFLKLLKNEHIEVWGGKQLRDFTYVDDCVDAFIAAASCDAAIGKIYNLGGDCVVNLQELAHLMIKTIGKGSIIEKEFPSERKKIDIGDYYANYDLIKNELGWRPKISLSEGIARTFTFYEKVLHYYL